jgi:hypothetical protein
MQQQSAAPPAAHPLANSSVAARLGVGSPGVHDPLRHRTGNRVCVVNMAFLLSGVGRCRGATVVPGTACTRDGRNYTPTSGGMFVEMLRKYCATLPIGLVADSRGGPPGRLRIVGGRA